MNLTPFNQSPPQLGNQYEEDRVLRHYLQQMLPPDMLAEIESSLQTMGEVSLF